MSATRYLLDTNVVSELRRPMCPPSLRHFIDSQDPASLHLSVLTVGELRKGEASLRAKDPARAAQLALWIGELMVTYQARILVVDLDIMSTRGELSITRTRPVVDTLLASTALVHNLTFVTRNTKDVADTGVKLFNPWLS